MADSRFPLGTKHNPCTAANSTPEERAHKYCQCEQCGTVSICTFGNDFYITEKDKVLRCESCFAQFLADEYDIDNVFVLDDNDSPKPDSDSDPDSSGN